MSYLVLTRRIQEKLLIGDDVEIIFLGLTCGCGVTRPSGCGFAPQAKFAIKAPKDVVILREEVKNRVVKS